MTHLFREFQYFVTLTRNIILGMSAAFSLLFPACFFRYARSLWLGMDLFWDPPNDKDNEVR